MRETSIEGSELALSAARRLLRGYADTSQPASGGNGPVRGEKREVPSARCPGPVGPQGEWEQPGVELSAKAGRGVWVTGFRGSAGSLRGFRGSAVAFCGSTGGFCGFAGGSGGSVQPRGFCRSPKIHGRGSVGPQGAWEVLGIHRWARGGSVGGSGAGGEGPGPSAVMETPLGYATPAAAKNLCSGMSGNVRHEIRSCCLQGFYPV